MRHLLFFSIFFIVAVSLKSQTYKQYEIEKLKAFFAQPSAIEGKNNGEVLGITDLDNPGSWPGITWHDNTGSPIEVKELHWSGEFQKPIIAGELDLKGFSSLTYLSCHSNQLTSLDVTKNTELNYLYCGSNQLTSLDVTKNTELNYLSCYNNQLTSLDVTKNTELTRLSCHSNQLTSLDVTKNTELNSLDCGSNQLTSLDVTKNTELNYLSCKNNQLTSFDVTKNTELNYLSCYNSQLTSLDVTKNTELTGLSCHSNQLTSLDVTKNTELNSLSCYNNQLTSLDVTKNTELTRLSCHSNQLTSLDVTRNTELNSLSCYNNHILMSQFAPRPSKADISSFYYYGQSVILGEKDNDSYYQHCNVPIDLSTEKNIDGTESTIVWKNVQGEEITPLSNNNWSFTFENIPDGEKIYCEITNPLFPDLTLYSNRIIIKNSFLVFPDQEFTINENAPNETVLGQLIATAPEQDALIFTIKGGNNNSAFAINKTTGELKVNNTDALDFETTQEFQLLISVSDSENTTEGTVTVKLNDLNELTSVNDLAAQGIHVYPIPADQWINVKFDNPNIPFNRYEIIDYSGKLILSGQIKGSKTEIDVNGMHKGLYLIQLQGRYCREAVKFSIK